MVPGPPDESPDDSGGTRLTGSHPSAIDFMCPVDQS
jgi:hypothetical protein